MPAPPFETFALYAGNSIHLKERVQVSGGHVGVRAATAGPHLFSGFELAINMDARVDPNWGVYGDSIRLDTRATVGNVYTNGLTQFGANFAQISSFTQLAPLPTPPVVNAGSSGVSVPSGATQSLMPGQYSAVTVNGTLRLSPGNFQIASLTLGNDARVEVLGVIELQIAGRVQLSDRARIGPATNTTVSARDILLITLGSNATSAPSSTPAALNLNNDAVMRALAYVPNGTARLGSRAQMTGAIGARDIFVDLDGRINFEEGFSCEGPSCDDGNSCTDDTCVLARCTHTLKLSGSSCADGNLCNGDETCNAAGTCVASAPPDVNDANPCTEDTCDPVLGVLHEPSQAGTLCADADQCNGTEECDGSGECSAGMPPAIDDDNPCTIDGCQPDSGPVHTPVEIGTSCADDDVCNGDEACTADAICLGFPPDPLPAGCTEPPTSAFCGDGIRDPITEECDDGPGLDEDSCSADCRIHNIFVRPVEDPGGLRTKSRSLDFGRHPLAASSSGTLVTYTEIAGSDYALNGALFDPQGRRVGQVDLSVGAMPSLAADAVTALLPGGAFAIAWNDLSAGSLDVGLRTLEVGSGTLSSPTHANSTVAGAQQDPDVIWTGNELVVAWADEGVIKIRRFGPSLVPVAAEQPLSPEGEISSDVSLHRIGSAWFAAWRALTPDGLEQVRVRNTESAWLIGPFSPGSSDERPALVDLDESHLLVAFTEGTDPFETGTSSVSRLRAAIVDLNQPGAVDSFALDALSEPYASMPQLSQTRPALARVGDRLFFAWESEALLGDALASEIWLQQLDWTQLGLTRAIEEPIRVDAPRAGNQFSPVLASSPLLPGGALVTVWEEHGADLLHETLPDIVFGLRPVPLLNLPGGGG